MSNIACIFVAGLLALTSSAWGSEKTDHVWKRLDGTALNSAFSDAELGDGAHFNYRFHANGNIEGTEISEGARGKWRTTARELCWRWTRPRGPEECYKVERRGRAVRGFRKGVEEWLGELSPLPANAK